MQKKTLISLIFSILLLQACSFPGVYKINVQQGNIVTQEMLDQLKPGMSRKQVHFVLGTPTLDNVFNKDVENYVYSYQKAGGDTKTQVIKVIFVNDEFSSYEGQPLEEHPAY